MTYFRSRQLSAGLLFGSLVFPAGAQEATTMPPAAIAPEVPSQLRRAIAADAQAKVAVATATSDLEAKLADAYSELQQLCKERFDALDRDQERYATAEARTNVVGSLLALIGSVTSYAAGKTVLVGLGISSSSSGNVSAGITQFFSKKSAADRATLVVLKSQLEISLDHYDTLDSTNDRTGVRRSRVLSRAKGICLGLTPSDDPGEKPKEGSAQPQAPTTPAQADPAASAIAPAR